MNNHPINTMTNYFWIISIGFGLCLILGLPPASAQQNNLDWLINTSSLDNKDAMGTHPRGLILPEELPAIREKVASGKLDTYLNKLLKETVSMGKSVNNLEVFDAQMAAKLAENHAIVYLLTGEINHASKAYQTLEKVFEDHLIFNNPVSRGLTRAAMLKSMAIAYDFCYPAWQQKERNLVNRQLYKIIYTTQANMGFEANYNLVSNWMGVRWGASLFAGLVWDNPDSENRSIADPLIWDATKRLKDHLKKNIYPQGWNAESIGYHLYNWSFVGPALIAFQNRHPGLSALETIAPHANYSLKAMASSMVNIQVNDRIIGLKPDLSDDNLFLGDGLFCMALRLYPQGQLGSINWMHDYLEENSLYTALYDADDLIRENPEKLGWLNHADTTQGVVIFRNQFESSLDIVALLNLSSRQISGHKGPDVNTFRLIAGGVPMVIGAGRTGLVAGQTNLFINKPDEKQKGNNSTGDLLTYAFTKDGSGHAIGKGSSMGVANHVRKLTVSFDTLTGAEAVLLLEDFSDNGKIWRLNTPEFNKVKLLKDGFIIQAPTGFTLRAQILNGKTPIQLFQNKLRYGGQTVRLNSGIIWNNKSYSHSTYIDAVMDRNIKVVLTLQTPGKPMPEIQVLGAEGLIKVGEIEFPLSNLNDYEN